MKKYIFLFVCFVILIMPDGYALADLDDGFMHEGLYVTGVYF